MEIVLNKILLQIRHQEDKLSSKMMSIAEEAYQMTIFLREMLNSIKAEVLQTGFKDAQQEMDFFRNIKPQVLGKLIYYIRYSVLKPPALSIRVKCTTVILKPN